MVNKVLIAAMFVTSFSFCQEDEVKTPWGTDVKAIRKETKEANKPCVVVTGIDSPAC